MKSVSPAVVSQIIYLINLFIHLKQLMCRKFESKSESDEHVLSPNHRTAHSFDKSLHFV